MLSVSSFESEGLSLCRRPWAGSRIFVFIRALGLGQPGKFFKCMIGGIPTQRFPPTPSSGTPWDRWAERSGVGSVQSFQEFIQHCRATGRIGRRCTRNWLDSASCFEALVNTNYVVHTFYKTQEATAGPTQSCLWPTHSADSWNPGCFWLWFVKWMSGEITRALSEACALLALPWVYQHAAVFLDIFLFDCVYQIG